MKTRWLAALAAAGALWGQEKPKPALSLQKAVEIALAPDGATRARLAAEVVKQSDTRRLQARAALLPNVDGSYLYRDFTTNLQSFGIQIPAFAGTPIALPALVGPIATNDLRVSGSQSLFDLAAIRRYQAARKQLEAVRTDETETRNQVRGLVAKAYLNALRAEAALETAKANVALAERVLRQARSQKDSGTGTGIEITRAQVMLANELQRQLSAVEDRFAARLNLQRSMNVSLGEDFELTEPMQYRPAEVPPEEKAIQAARELRPLLAAQARREEGARLSYEAVKSERYPSARAIGDYGVLGRTDGALIPTRQVGISVTVPIWDGGRRDARRTEAASLMRSEELKMRDTAQQVELDVRLAVEALRTAESLVRVALEAQTQSERELEQAERRVSAGVAPSLEVTDAQARLARARETAVSAVFHQKTARIDLSVAVGNADMAIE
jgi:outer membrane protein TolC